MTRVVPQQPPEGKRARTRKLLLETAAALVREKGFSNVSMEEVAARAGVSRGSIYGNFRDRHELLAAVAIYRMPRIAPAPAPGMTLREQLRALGRAVAQAARDNRSNTIYWAAYMQHALSDEELLRRAVVQSRQMRRQMTREWTKAMPAGSLPVPVDKFVKIVGALTTSLIMSHSMSPDDYDEDVIVAAFEVLAGPAKRTRAAKKPKPTRR
jgi:AcrR family transcriptional regulator